MSDRKEAFEETPLAIVWNARAAQTIAIAGVSLACSFGMAIGGVIFWYALIVATLAAAFIPLMHRAEIAQFIFKKTVSQHLALPAFAFIVIIVVIPMMFFRCVEADHQSEQLSDSIKDIKKSEAQTASEFRSLTQSIPTDTVKQQTKIGTSPSIASAAIMPAVQSEHATTAPFDIVTKSPLPPVSTASSSTIVHPASGPLGSSLAKQGIFVDSSQEGDIATEVADYIAGKLPSGHIKIAPNEQEAGIIFDITVDNVGTASLDAADPTGAIWHSTAAITVAARQAGNVKQLYTETFQAQGQSQDLDRASPIALINSANAAVAAITHFLN